MREWNFPSEWSPEFFDFFVREVVGKHGRWNLHPFLLIQDIQALRPTVLPVVPRVLNKIHDKIQAGMAAAGGMKQSLFNAALHAKTEGLKHGHLKHGLYDFLIFNRIKKALGMGKWNRIIRSTNLFSPTS